MNKKERPTVTGYFIVSSAGIPCRLDFKLHKAGALVPTKAGEKPWIEQRQTHLAHPERGALGRLRSAIKRTARAAAEYRESLHRDHPPFAILIHAGPYALRRIWELPDGTTKNTEYPKKASDK